MSRPASILHTARWVLPVSQPPLLNGAVLIQGDVIVAVGRQEELLGQRPDVVTDHGQAVIFPGLVNGHTHLEFSALRGKVERYDSFTQWLRKVAWRRLLLSQKQIEEGAKRAAQELVDYGTALVGDVANLIDTGQVVAGLPIHAVIFHEVIGLKKDKATEILERRLIKMRSWSDSSRVIHTLSPHAPYSVSQELLQKTKAWCREKRKISAVHLAESPEEVELCQKGSGPLKRLLSFAGLWDKGWQVPGKSPVAYADQLGLLDEKTLAVHLVRADRGDVEILAQRGSSICLCVRSNEITGVGQSPVKLFLKAGLNTCLGTDSLASNHDLNMLEEMKGIKGLHPYLSEETILRMASLNGALALDFGDRLGSLEPGKEAFLLSLPLGEERNPYQAIFSARGLPKRISA